MRQFNSCSRTTITCFKSNKSPRQRRPVWHDFAEHFTDPRECLASLIALEAAEVIAGIKPANLFPLPNRTYPCGRNPYQLWKQMGDSVIGATSMNAFEMQDRNNSILILLYNPAALGTLIRQPAVRVILARAGYKELVLTPILLRLAQRLAAGKFPHEVGIFLGYPLKDVVGFMGLAPIPFTCQGPWKIYGNPAESLCLAEKFRCCRSQMAVELAKGSSPSGCLGGIPSSSSKILRPSIEINNQSQHRRESLHE